MPDTVTKAEEAAAQAAASAEVKKPQPLTTGELFVATLMMIAGLVLIGVTLYAFSSTDASFVFKAKEKTVSEPVFRSSGTTGKPKGGGAQGKVNAQGAQAKPAYKKTSEVDYADTVVIFALTAGAALALAGGFYSRLRSLKLGALELGLVSEEDKKTAKDAAAAKVADKVAGPDKPAAEAAAGAIAAADLTKAVALGVQPTEPVIEGIADQAAMKVAEAMQTSRGDEDEWQLDPPR